MARINGEIIPRHSRSRDARVAERYVAGIGLQEIAAEFGLSRTGVHRALVRADCPRRRRGTDQAVDYRNRYPQESQYPVHPKAPSVGPRVWCRQCERNVVMDEAECCGNQWCKARVGIPA